MRTKRKRTIALTLPLAPMLGAILAILTLSNAATPAPQTASSLKTPPADPALMAEVHRIKAIDNHSHPPRVVALNDRDDEFDALPRYPFEPTLVNVTLRPDNLMFLAAWKALWGYRYNDRSPQHVAEMLAHKKRMQQAKGDAYPAWVLDQLGIETKLANREALGIALTGMMQDGEITRARAEEIARMVLPGNALKLYGWADPS